jgi:hypothetical protein
VVKERPGKREAIGLQPEESSRTFPAIRLFFGMEAVGRLDSAVSLKGESRYHRFCFFEQILLPWI